MKIYTKEELHKIAKAYVEGASDRMKKAVAEALPGTKEYLNIRMYEYARKGLTYLLYDLGILRVIAEKADGFDREEFIKAIKQELVPYFTEKGFNVLTDLTPSSYIKISWE